MTKFPLFGLTLWLLNPSFTPAQAASDPIELGRLANGAAVTFVRGDSGDWGIEISGGAGLQMRQPKPAQIEVYRDAENVSQVAAGYQSVKKEADAVVATAIVAGGGAAAFAVEDQWKVSGTTLSLNRKVNVTTAEDNVGFFSAIRLVTAPTVKWEDVNCLIYNSRGLLVRADDRHGHEGRKLGSGAGHGAQRRHDTGRGQRGRNHR